MAKSDLNKLRSLIRAQLAEILEEECCDKCKESECKCNSVKEINTTSNIDGYQTPFAFSKDDEEDHKSKIKDTAEVFDYKTAETSKNNTISEGRSLYHILRDHPDMSNVQKVGTVIRKVNKMLDEVNLLLGITGRFKTESNIRKNDCWKTTNRFLDKADIKLKKISEKIRNIR
jgi:hypothetical protein